MSDLNKWLTMGSILVTIEHERSHTRLEYRDIPVLQSFLRYLLNWFYSEIHLQDLWNRFQFVLKFRHFENNLLAGCVYPTPSYPSKVLAILCEPCFRKIKIFATKPNFSSLIRGDSMMPPRSIGFWPSGPKPCGGNDDVKSSCDVQSGKTPQQELLPNRNTSCINQLSTFNCVEVRKLTNGHWGKPDELWKVRFENNTSLLT